MQWAVALLAFASLALAGHPPYPLDPSNCTAFTLGEPAHLALSAGLVAACITAPVRAAASVAVLALGLLWDDATSGDEWKLYVQSSDTADGTLRMVQLDRDLLARSGNEQHRLLFPPQGFAFLFLGCLLQERCKGESAINVTVTASVDVGE
jgi:hypothetical protein